MSTLSFYFHSIITHLLQLNINSKSTIVENSRPPSSFDEGLRLFFEFHGEATTCHFPIFDGYTSLLDLEYLLYKSEPETVTIAFM